MIFIFFFAVVLYIREKKTEEKEIYNSKKVKDGILSHP